jgi:hypothetical protein
MEAVDVVFRLTFCTIINSSGQFGRLGDDGIT